MMRAAVLLMLPWHAATLSIIHGAGYSTRAARRPLIRLSAAPPSEAPARVVLEPDYRLAKGLAGGSIGFTLGIPFVGALVGLPLGALAAFLASRTQTVRFVFDTDALEVMASGGGGGELRESAPNFAVGGRNRWGYADIVEWAMYPSPESPVLVYFRENQTTTAGQGHLFPVLFSPERLRQLMEERVGGERRITGPPRLN
jgi:hypothetical protein